MGIYLINHQETVNEVKVKVSLFEVNFLRGLSLRAYQPDREAVHPARKVNPCRVRLTVYR